MKKHFIGLGLTVLLSACGSDSHVATNSVTPNSKSHLYLGTISTIPLGSVANSAHKAKSTKSGLQTQAHKSVAKTIATAGNSGSVTYITVVNNLDVTAKLDSIQVKGDAAVVAKPSQFIDTTACQKVVPHGLCNIVINPPNHNGSFALTVNYDVGSSSQLVSYQKNMPPVNGFVFNNGNDLLVKKKLPERAAFSVPFVLAQDLSSLRVSSNKPGFVNTRVICNGASTNHGNLCTILGEVNANTPNGAVSVTLAGVLRNSDEETSVTFPVVVNNEQAPNLVTTGANVVINGSATQSVTILNNGNVVATGIQITANPNAINIAPTEDGCSSLEPGQSCSVNVSSTAAQNFQGSVNVSWSGEGTSGSTSFNVVYVAPGSSPGLAFTLSGNLTYTTKNESSDIAITVENNGSVPLTNINPLKVVSINPALTYVTPTHNEEIAACATDGSQVLDKDETCVLQIHYLPTTVESHTFDFSVASTYANSDGKILNYSPGRVQITYSSIETPAFLVSNPGEWGFAIRADNHESAIESFEITNSGSINTKIEDIQLVGSNVELLTGPSACQAGTTVLESETGNYCKIYVKYGPKESDESGVNNLKIKYKPTPITKIESMVTLDVPIHYLAKIAALVKVTDVSVTGAYSGNGSAGSQYEFFNKPGTPLTTTITYKNVGTLQADKFNVNLANLRIGLDIGSGTCGKGDSTTALLPDQECTLVLKAVDDRIYNYLNIHGTFNINIPGFSYTDSNTGLNTQAAPFYEPIAGNEVYISAFTFAGLSTDGATVSASDATENQAFDLVFTSAGGDENSYPLTVTVLGTGGIIYPATVGNCTINSAEINQTCTIHMLASPGTPAGNYTYLFKVSPNGSTDGYLQTVQVTVE